MLKPEYIGDGVYVSSNLADGFPLIITTGDLRPTRADNTVFFEPVVLKNLITQLRLAYPDLFKS